MLHIVDETLKNILFDSLDTGGRHVEVHFHAPNLGWANSLNSPAINCYLCDIREVKLSLDEVLKAGFDKIRDKRTRRSPQYFDFIYIITAWSQEPRDEHVLLFNTLEALTTASSLADPNYFSDSNILASAKIVQTEDYKLLADKFWSAAQIPPKPCLTYRVTLPINFNYKVKNAIEVELRLNITMEEFPLEIRDLLLMTIDEKTKAKPKEITLIDISSGSVLVTLEMPLEAALELMRLYLGRDSFIKEFKIENIEFKGLLSGYIKQLPGAQKTPVRILFLAANPKDTQRLRLDEEVREIDEVLLQKSEFRDKFEIHQQWAVRITELQTHFLRFRPHIVHFSGHGSASNEIILQDAAGNAVTVPNHALSQLFLELKDDIRCVVLSTCYSEPQARAIAEHIDCVIGMSSAIGDHQSISFSKSFYQAIGFGRSVDTAFKLGISQIDLEKLEDKHVPQLLANKNCNPASIVFV